jgi:5-formyltetrahydrofolate cyclo-ligase
VTKGAKRAIRRELLQRRAGVGAGEGATEALTARLLALDVLAQAERVAAYWPFGTEPSPVGAIEALAARGATVLLPVGLADGDLDWAPYAGPDGLTPGRWRFAEPGSAPLGPDSIATVDAVIAPALAVDGSGGRLGRGSGAYDRALARVRPGVPIIAIVYDEEVLDEVPMEAHDRRVTHVVTPRRTVVVPGAHLS